MVLTGGFHDTTFSPDRQWLAYVIHDRIAHTYLQGDLIVQPIILGGVDTTGLHSDALGEPVDGDGVTFIGLWWIDSQRLLFNAMDTYSASLFRPNHMDLHLFNRQKYGEDQHMEIFGDGEGGWAIPSPSGRYVAVFNREALILLDGETLTPLQEPIVFEHLDEIFSCETFGCDYPDYQWSADEDELWFWSYMVSKEGTKNSCFLNTDTLTLTCGEAIPRHSLFTGNLDTVAYILDNQIAIASRLPDGNLEEVVQVPESEEHLPVRWIDSQTLLYRKIINLCTESENPAPSHYFTYSLETGESTPWLEDRNIMVVQQFDESWFAVASGDCETVLVELVNPTSDTHIQLAETSHPNSIYWFRFVD